MKFVLAAIGALVIGGMAFRYYNVHCRPVRHAEFFDNGGLREVGSFLDGEPFGEWVTYYPGGGRQTAYTIDKAGRLNDSLFKWYPTGEIWVRGFYTHGKKSNCWVWYSVDGNVEREECY